MREGKLSHVTGDAVRDALDGCFVALPDDSNFEILATHVRTALESTILPEILDPDRLSNEEIQKKLVKLSKISRTLHNEISTSLNIVDHQLAKESFRGDGFVNFIGFIFSDISRYSRFYAIASKIESLSDFLDIAARNTERQAPKWRQNARRQLRIWRAERLIPVFESAFGRNITINSWPFDSRHHRPTPFMDFYQRMVTLAFGENSSDDLSAVLKEARKSIKVRMSDTASPGE